MIYLILFLIMSLVCIIQVFSKKINKTIFFIFGFIITALSMFRFGSGVDYFSYYMHYYLNPSTIKEAIFYKSNMDLGYKLLMGLFKSMNLSYEIFIIIVTLIIMICFISIINKNSEFKLMSLLILFSIYYLVYVNSAIRQGIAMAIFFVAFYKYLKYDKTLKYLLLILIASLIHKSVLITLLIPLIKHLYKKVFNNKILNLMLLVIALSLCIFNANSIFLMFAQVLGMSTVYEVTRFNPLAVALRLILLIFIFVLYKASDIDDDFSKFQIYTYFIGSVLFIAVANIQILSRILEYFTLLEIILIPNFIKTMNVNLKFNKTVCFLFAISLFVTIFIKDINAISKRSGYYVEGIKGYKYISIFNKTDLYEYRNINADLYNID